MTYIDKTFAFLAGVALTATVALGGLVYLVIYLIQHLSWGWK